MCLSKNIEKKKLTELTKKFLNMNDNYLKYTHIENIIEKIILHSEYDLYVTIVKFNSKTYSFEIDEAIMNASVKGFEN